MASTNTDMEVKTKPSKKQIMESRYKKSYGNRQAGAGRGYLQRDSFQHKFQRMKYKEDLKKRKREDYMEKHGITDEKADITEDQLNFLPAFAKEQEETADDEQQPKPKKQKVSKLKKAKNEYLRINHEKQEKKLERDRMFKEKLEKQKARKERALHVNKKITQKTRRGQPIMHARMELLFEKINEFCDKQ